MKKDEIIELLNKHKEDFDYVWINYYVGYDLHMEYYELDGCLAFDELSDISNIDFWHKDDRTRIKKINYLLNNEPIYYTKLVFFYIKDEDCVDIAEDFPCNLHIVNQNKDIIVKSQKELNDIIHEKERDNRIG